ncbi:MAG: hypothetical protein ACR2FY_09160 [Pirellulaceae bacterium]
MPEDLNPYASPALIPHDRAPSPVDPLEPLLGPSLGLLLSSALVFLFGCWLLPRFIYEMAQPNADISEAILLPMFFASVPMFIGAWNMRCGTRYRRAYAAAVLACIPMITPAGWCGIPLGIWTLIVLHRKDVKAVFAARAASTS